MAVGKGLEAMTDYLVPLLLLLVSALALKKGQNGYGTLLEGAADGLKLVGTVLPSLVLLMTAVHMLRASGAAEYFGKALAPVLSVLGIPPECVLLVLIRPISGSAALAVGAELMAAHGPDSLVGRTAAVMLGSTETTFYTVAVYFGAVGIKNTRHTIAAALLADFTGMTMAVLVTRIMLC